MEKVFNLTPAEIFEHAFKLVQEMDIQIIAGYASSSEGSEDDIIALANWNNIDDSVSNQLEELEINLEWSDEWRICDACNRAIRTNPDSYHFKPQYWFHPDGAYICEACTVEDPDDYLEYLQSNPHACLTMSINLKDYGYRNLNANSCETGFHPGQNDDPRTIYNELTEAGFENFIFVLDEQSQFYQKWSVWLHENEDA